MCPVALCQPHKPAPVKVDPAKVQVIRIFPGHQAPGIEPHLSALGIDMVHFAHNPLTASDLVLNLSFRNVIEPQVRPTVPLAHPQQFPRFPQPVTPDLVRIIHKRARPFLRYNTRPAIRGIHGNDSIELVPALVILENELAAVPRPPHIITPIRRIRRREKLIGYFQRLGIIHAHHDQVRPGERVSWFRVIKRLHPGLELIRG